MPQAIVQNALKLRLQERVGNDLSCVREKIVSTRTLAFSRDYGVPTYSTSFLRLRTRPSNAHNSLSTCSEGVGSETPRSIS